MSHPVKSLRYIKCHSSRSPRLIKSLTSSIRYNFQKICSLIRPEAIVEIRKEAMYLEVISKSFIYKFSKDFTNHINKTKRAKVFRRGPLPNIHRYRGHRLDLPTIWKTRFLQTHIEKFS